MRPRRSSYALRIALSLPSSESHRIRLRTVRRTVTSARCSFVAAQFASSARALVSKRAGRSHSRSHPPLPSAACARLFPSHHTHTTHPTPMFDAHSSRDSSSNASVCVVHPPCRVPLHRRRRFLSSAPRDHSATHNAGRKKHAARKAAAATRCRSAEIRHSTLLRCDSSSASPLLSPPLSLPPSQRDAYPTLTSHLNQNTRRHADAIRSIGGEGGGSNHLRSHISLRWRRADERQQRTSSASSDRRSRERGSGNERKQRGSSRGIRILRRVFHSDRLRRCHRLRIATRRCIRSRLTRDSLERDSGEFGWSETTAAHPQQSLRGIRCCRRGGRRVDGRHRSSRRLWHAQIRRHRQCDGRCPSAVGAADEESKQDSSAGFASSFLAATAASSSVSSAGAFPSRVGVHLFPDLSDLCRDVLSEGMSVMEFALHLEQLQVADLMDLREADRRALEAAQQDGDALLAAHTAAKFRAIESLCQAKDDRFAHRSQWLAAISTRARDYMTQRRDVSYVVLMLAYLCLGMHAAEPQATMRSWLLRVDALCTQMAARLTHLTLTTEECRSWMLAATHAHAIRLIPALMRQPNMHEGCREISRLIAGYCDPEAHWVNMQPYLRLIPYGLDLALVDDIDGPRTSALELARNFVCDHPAPAAGAASHSAAMEPADVGATIGLDDPASIPSVLAAIANLPWMPADHNALHAQFMHALVPAWRAHSTDVRSSVVRVDS